MTAPHHIASLIKTCDELGFPYTLEDHFSQQLIRVSHNGSQCLFGGGSICAFPINSATSVTVVRDKSHTINVLQNNGYTVPTGNYFFTRLFKIYEGQGKSVKDAMDYAESVGYPLIAKPNDGSHGAFVEKLRSAKDLQTYVAKIADKVGCFRLEKPLAGREFRLLIVDGEPWYSYCRMSPQLVFDGIHTVKQHVKQQIECQSQEGFSTITFDSPSIDELLTSHNWELGSIPSKGVCVALSAANNISVGGEASDYRELFTDTESAFANNLAQLFNLRVMGVDLFLTEDEQDLSKATILEINGNPGLSVADQLSKTHIISRLWQFVLQETFNKCLINQN